MENQHRKITGYRELTQTEIDLMNQVKALGVQIEDVLLQVDNHIRSQRGVSKPVAETNRMNNATPERFLALAKTELQTGLMYATRAVAQPELF